MINLKNITPEMKAKCTSRADRYLDTVRFSGVELIRTIMNELPEEAVLIGANMINAYRRNDRTEHLDMTPASYIIYTLDDFIVNLEFGHFWMFEGVQATAYPIVDVKYRTTRYGISFAVDVQGGVLELIEAARNPKRIYDQMELIKADSKQDLAYINDLREVTETIYIG